MKDVKNNEDYRCCMFPLSLNARGNQLKWELTLEREMSIYIDHSVKFCVLRHKMYHVISPETWIILRMLTVKSACYPVLAWSGHCQR